MCSSDLTAKDGSPKFLKECTYPVTSTRKIDMIITELAVFERKDDKFELIELMGDATLEEIAEKTEADYVVSDALNRSVKS